MKISPLQLVHLSFRKISVEVDAQHLPPEPQPDVDEHSLFDGVVLKSQVSKTRLQDDDTRGTPYFLTFSLVLDNQPDPASTRQKFSPYRLDIEVGAVVILRHGAEKLGDPEDLVAVNGPALIWGAIREQVATLTARMPAGTALLPSVNFHDLKKSALEAASEQAKTPAAKPAAKRARKPKS